MPRICRLTSVFGARSDAYSSRMGVAKEKAQNAQTSEPSATPSPIKQLEQHP